MEIALVLRLLDMAYLGFTAYQDYQLQAQQDAKSAELVKTLREKILRGELTEEQALAELDQIIGGIVGRRRAAFAQLPVPQ